MRAFVAILAACAILTGCSPAVRACTMIGASPGVSVTVERTVAADLTALRLRICSGETCVTRAVDLHPGSATVDQGCTGTDPDDTCSATASPDGTLVGFVDLEQLAEGPVQVSATAVVAGRSRQFDEVTVQSALVYPNGKDCGGLGPQAQVTLGPDGLR